MMKTAVATFVLLLLLTAQVRAQSTPAPSPRASGSGGRQSPKVDRPGEDVAEGDVVHVTANLVSVPVSVMNRQGQSVVDLQRQDFRVFEDGVEQTIVHFSNVDQPFSVVLLIDTSGSTAPFIEQIKGAAKAFVEQLRPADTVRPIYFHGEIKPLTADGISDLKVFSAAIDQIEPGPINLGTRLYDAVAFALKSAGPASPRKAVVLITDGENTWGKATMKGTLRAAEESGVIFYPVQYGDLPPQKYLLALADKTGGRYFRGGQLNSLRQSFAEVAAELRRQYVLGYEPQEPERSGVRKIRVKVNRSHVAVRARKFYTYTH